MFVRRKLISHQIVLIISNLDEPAEEAEERGRQKYKTSRYSFDI